MTKAIKILERSGFIERLIDEKDKRNYKLYCTVKGKSIVEGFNDYKTVVEETVLEGMSSADIQQMYKYLEHIHRNSSKLVNWEETLKKSHTPDI